MIDDDDIDPLFDCAVPDVLPVLCVALAAAVLIGTVVVCVMLRAR